MKRYLLGIYQPDGPPPPPTRLTTILRDVAAVRLEMQAAGVWVLAGGLCPPSATTVVRAGKGDALITDGPFAEAKEYLGGLTIISARDLDAALSWASKLAKATTLPVEVRPFQEEAAGS